MKEQPKIDVGIVSRKELRFFLSSSFFEKNQQFSAGEYIATVEKNRISILTGSGEKFEGDSFLFISEKSHFLS